MSVYLFLPMNKEGHPSNEIMYMSHLTQLTLDLSVVPSLR